MRPSRQLLWMMFAAVIFALAAAIMSSLPVEAALLPMAILLVVAVVDWLISVRGTGVELTVSISPENYVGENIKIDLILQPNQEKGRLPFNGIEAHLQPVEAFDDPGPISFQSFGRSETIKSLTARIQPRARRRGRFALERIWLCWKSRLGLIEFVPVKVFQGMIAIVPNIRPVTSGQIDFELRNALHGTKQSTQRGEGSEFHQLTDYVQGMDPRSIDWKHSARRNSLVAKEMRAERNHPIMIAIDNGLLMREDIAGLPRIDHKINAALSLAWAGVQGGDLVGLFTFDARPRLFIPPAPGRGAFARLRGHMASLAYRSVETNHTFALSSLQERLNRRSLVIILSDFADPLAAELLMEQLAVMRRHHVVVFVALQDPELEQMARSQPQSIDEIARSVSAANLLAERRLVFEQISALGIDVLECAAGQMTPRLLNTYLDIKARELI